MTSKVELAVIVTIAIVATTNITNISSADGELDTIEPNKDYTTVNVAQITKYFTANATDNITLNWVTGDKPTTEYRRFTICSYMTAISWTNLSTDTNACPTSMDHQYTKYFGTGSTKSPPQSFSITAPYSGIYAIVIYRNGDYSTQITYNVTIRKTIPTPNMDIDEINDRLDRLENILNATNDTINNLISVIGDIDIQIQQIAQNITALWNNIAALSLQITNISKQISSDETNISKLQETANSIQEQLNELREKLSNINITGGNVNLTTINQSIATLTKTVNELDRTVNRLNDSIPPDLTGDVEKLHNENNALKEDVEYLKQRPSTNTTINRTIYENNTITKHVSEAGIARAIGAVGIVGVAGLLGLKGRRRSKDETVMLPKAENGDNATTRTTDAPEETTPAEKNEGTQTIPLAQATVVPQGDRTTMEKPRTITISTNQYTEADIMAKLTSLPRGLPPELSDEDITTLAGRLMTAKYAEDEEGEIIVNLGKKWFYGNPAKTSTYMQRADPPREKEPNSPSIDSELDEILKKV